jgi:nicotinamide-nucleotide amidase
MQDLVMRAAEVAARLKARGETIAVAESSTGGILRRSAGGPRRISVFPRRCRGLHQDGAAGPARHFRRGDEAYAWLVSRTARGRFATTWAIGETGAAGPTGNRYGDAPGHSCIAIAGAAERAITIETGSADRYANMCAFTAAALDLLMQALEGAKQ